MKKNTTEKLKVRTQDFVRHANAAADQPLHQGCTLTSRIGEKADYPSCLPLVIGDPYFSHLVTFQIMSRVDGP